jgi:hypothetical protein
MAFSVLPADVNVIFFVIAIIIIIIITIIIIIMDWHLLNTDCVYVKIVDLFGCRTAVEVQNSFACLRCLHNRFNELTLSALFVRNQIKL